MSNIDEMRQSAKIVSKILLELKSLTKPDVNLDMLDELASRRIVEMGATSYNKGYKPEGAEIPYPSTICASVNEEICHAPPAGRILKEGDIVTYDIGIRYKSGCGDAALTVAVGEIDNRKQRAMRYGLKALNEGIQVVKSGISVTAIGSIIERTAMINGYTTIKEYGGHTIGKEMHEKPYIPNYYDHRKKVENDRLMEGQVICIEPMITPGNGKMGLMGDKWTAFVLDRQPVVMYEAMILVKKSGFEILTTHL